MRRQHPHGLIIIMLSSVIDQSLCAGFSLRQYLRESGRKWILVWLACVSVSSVNAQGGEAEEPLVATPQAPEQLQYVCVAPADGTEVNRFADGPELQRFIDSDIEVAANELLLQADSAIYDGEVDLRRGDLYLHADRASLDLQSQNVQLLGSVEVALPGARLQGDSASINLNNNASVISGAEYFIQDAPSMTGSASSVELDENNVVSISNGTYTRCDPSAKQWELVAGELRLDPDSGQGYARATTVKVFGAPIIYIPRLRFPIGDQRQSGFLFPSITRRSEGLDISVPYYFNLASNYDLLLSPRYRAGHGYLTEAQMRWMNRFDLWELNTLFIDSDESMEDNSRWAISLDESSHWVGNIQSRVSINRVSDADVPRDLQSSNFSLSRSSALAMNGQLQWFLRYGVIGASVNRYQSIDPALEIPNEKLPELWSEFALPSRGLLPGLDADLQYTLFEADSLIETAGSNSVQRTRGRLEFHYNLNRSLSRWRFGVGSQFRYYALEENDSGSEGGLLEGERDKWINVPEASIQWSSEWIRRSGSISELLQPELAVRYRTLEAGASSLNQLPALDAYQTAASPSELYEIGQFGGDALDPRSHARFAVRYARTDSSEHSDSLDATGPAEQSHITLGALNYFEQKLPNSTDDESFASQRRWFAQAASRLGAAWLARAEIVWSQDQSVIDYSSVHLQYRQVAAVKRSPVFNLSYQRREDSGRFSRREDIEHVDLSAAYPLFQRWALFGRVQYDTVNRRHAEGLAGVEFNDCCVRLRLLYRDGIVYRPAQGRGERDRAFLLQIQLKGLGGIGDSVDDLLERSIRGFRAE